MQSLLAIERARRTRKLTAFEVNGSSNLPVKRGVAGVAQLLAGQLELVVMRHRARGAYY